MNAYNQQHAMAQQGEDRQNRRRDIADIMGVDELARKSIRARTGEKERIVKLKRERCDGLGMTRQAMQDPSIKPFATEDDPNFGRDSLTKELCLNPKIDGSFPTGSIGEDTHPAIVHRGLSLALKPHQIIGVRFLWSHVALAKAHGCILADFMGLGKTLQVITLIHSFLNRLTLPKGSQTPIKRWKHVLVLAPVICVRNWEAEFAKWFTPQEILTLGVFVLEASKDKNIKERHAIMSQWSSHGGILLMGYEVYRTLILKFIDHSGQRKKDSVIKKKDLIFYEEIFAFIAKPGPDLIILDEGHRIRDSNTMIVKALSFLKTARRIVLTGYPVQNHLKEYWTMVNFARDHYLGNKSEFANRFANPINNGQCIDSLPSDVVLSRKRAFVLTLELDSIVLRRNQQFLVDQLPPKREWAILTKLSPLQIKLYRAFLRDGRAPDENGNQAKKEVLVSYHVCMSIANHPDVLYKTFQKLVGEVVMGLGLSSDSDADDDELDEIDDILHSYQKIGGKSRTRADAALVGTSHMDDEVDAEMEILRTVSPKTKGHRLSFAEPFLENYTLCLLENSGKMLVLLYILERCRELNDRVTVFSQSVQTLEVIKMLLNEYNQKQEMQLSKPPLFHRTIDGSTSQRDRRAYINEFNDEFAQVDVMLISTKAGGEGVNLIGGNRVVMFDVCWNPSHDIQAMCRSYRFGQTKPVHVYRLIAGGTMEKKVYDLQVYKQNISKRIVDDTALQRRFMEKDLKNYFNIQEFKAMQKALRYDPSGQKLEKLETENVSAMVEQMRRQDVDRESVAGDSVLSNLATVHGGWLLDVYQQEHMFEEDENEKCPVNEQAAAMADYEKEVGLGKLIDQGSLKCPSCQKENPIDAEKATAVIVSGDLRCIHCKYFMIMNNRSEILSTLKMSASASSTVTSAVANQKQPKQEMVAGIPKLPPMSSQMTDATFQGIPKLENGTFQDTTELENATFQDTTKMENATFQGITKLESSGRSIPSHLPHAKRIKGEKLLTGRRILLITRGIPDKAALRSLGEEHGALFEVELTPRTTDIVTIWPPAKVLVCLRLKKIPSHVILRSPEWLRNLLNLPSLIPALPAEGNTLHSTGLLANDMKKENQWTNLATSSSSIPEDTMEKFTSGVQSTDWESEEEIIIE